jgi:hypothetical protein
VPIPDGPVSHRPRLPGPACPQPPNVRVSPGVRLPPTSATGGDVTADAACSGAPVIVDLYLVHEEVEVHANPDAVPGAPDCGFCQVASRAGLGPVNAMPSPVSPYGPWPSTKVHRGFNGQPRAGQALGQLA